jgi:alkanesulfonate monooxygenase SsuD/methylene tetrahydromethanopterin reductase-like flavin-dependent oxidoreductase (luciferase family)
MALAIIGGQPARFAPLVELYRRNAAQTGHDPQRLPVSINVHGYVAETSQQAADEYYPSHASVMNRIGRERGWTPGTRQDYDASLALPGALVVGSPEQVAEKILFHHQIFKCQRYLVQMSVGPMAHAKIMRSIELFATKVAPLVRDGVTASVAR